MAALAIHIENNASYESSIKNADTMMKILTNASFRSLFLWNKDEHKNKREEMDYEPIQSLPMEFRMFILDQMTRQEEIYKIKRRSAPKGSVPAPFSQQAWLAKVRSLFGIANGHAYLKQVMVMFEQ